MQDITADDFITTLFPPDLLHDDERICVAHPAHFISQETGERVDYYRQLNWRPGALRQAQSWYFCVSTIARQRQRQVKKRLEDVRTAFVLVVDDVGTKSLPPRVPPSYRLETSAGNYQWGYLIEPFDVSTDAGAVYYDMCLVSLAAAGHNDLGFRSANRLARLPGSLHSSGWAGVVREWAPARSWVLAELMADFGVPLLRGAVRRRAERAPGNVTALDDVTDPLYGWLAETGRVLGHGDDFVYVECPWRSGHTDGKQGATSTGFSPAGYGRYWARGFRCLHGHCSGYAIRHFEEWARRQGADINGGGVL